MLTTATAEEVYKEFVESDDVKLITMADLRKDDEKFDPSTEITKLFAKIVYIHNNTKGDGKPQQYTFNARARGNDKGKTVKSDLYSYYIVAR